MPRPPKELSTREIAFAKSRQCVFCGGGTLATTVDHYPPKGLFTEHKWPEGYVFPACEACNRGSKDQENMVALLCRINAGPEGNSDPAIEEMRVIFDYFKNNHAGLILGMKKFTRAEQRAAARRIGWRPATGELWSRAPVLKVPSEIHDSVRVFATKLIRALHFEHTQKIVPANAGIKVFWFTNAQQMEGRIPQEVFTTLPGFATLRRTQVDLSDQFNYRYQVSDDGQLGMYTAWFRFSFVIHGMLSFDLATLDGIETEARAQHDPLTPPATQSDKSPLL